MNDEKKTNHKCRIKIEKNAKSKMNRCEKRSDKRKETCIQRERERKLRVDQTRRVKGGRNVSL